jgi:hypothetical protein
MQTSVDSCSLKRQKNTLEFRGILPEKKFVVITFVKRWLKYTSLETPGGTGPLFSISSSSFMCIKAIGGGIDALGEVTITLLLAPIIKISH